MELSVAVVLSLERCASLDQHANDSELACECGQTEGELQRRLALSARARIVDVDHAPKALDEKAHSLSCFIITGADHRAKSLQLQARVRDKWSPDFRFLDFSKAWTLLLYVSAKESEGKT